MDVDSSSEFDQDLYDELKRLQEAESLYARPLLAARREVANPSHDRLNIKERADWTLFRGAGQLRVTFEDDTAVVVARMLNGLDILVGTVIAFVMDYPSGLMISENGGVINPWHESALVVSELGEGSVWFLFDLSVTERLIKIIKRADRSNIVSGVFLLVVQGFSPMGTTTPRQDIPYMPPALSQKCDIRGDVGDLMKQVQEAQRFPSSITISYECEAKKVSVTIDPRLVSPQPYPPND